MADPRLTTLVVSEQDIATIENTLETFLFDSHANFGLLLDRSGQIIATKGKAPDCNLTTIGALIAGTFASARELAKALKEKEFSVLFQQGSEQHVLTTLVDDQWLLSVLFDQRAFLGLVKVLAKDTAHDLTAVLNQVRARRQAPGSAVGKDLQASAEQRIDSLFRDS